MEYKEFSSIFEEIATKNGLDPLPSERIARFHCFTEYLLEVNAHTNLTAIRTVPEIIAKHYVDSLLALSLLPQGSRVLDLGCGPGFPSIPLAIVRPDLQIVALDSTAKKIRFVQENAEKLHLNNLQAVAGRAEDTVVRTKLGQFDVVVSRAVARLNVLCELCLPYVSVGGKLVALKAAKAEEELTEAKRAVQILGGATPTLRNTELVLPDGTREPRALIEIPKTKAAPEEYPRAYAAILKKPL